MHTLSIDSCNMLRLLTGLDKETAAQFADGRLSAIADAPLLLAKRTKLPLGPFLFSRLCAQSRALGVEPSHAGQPDGRRVFSNCPPRAGSRSGARLRAPPASHWHVGSESRLAWP